tara:strand:+ start:19 stop:630 length:612 start_codon:yes stop_codon:yes gene_type:complete
MFALVESGSITKMLRGNKGIEIGGVKHPASIFTLWSESERNDIGIYTIEINSTNLKDEDWYVNTDITYSYDSSAKKVKGTYGTATAKAHADTTYTNTDKSNGIIPTGKDVGDVKDEGLKTILIRQVKAEAKSKLDATDWYVTRKSEEGTAIPSAITTHRKAVRTKQAEMETAITNAADTAALETLYKRGDNNERPLGDLPNLE